MTTAPPVQNPTPNTTVAGKIALAALALTVVGWLIYIEFTGGLDFNVYRLGAMTIFDNEGMHKDLYARDLLDYGALKLPFTYPPFAALLFVPFAFLPFGVGVGIMYTISIGVAWWMATLIYDYATSRGYHIPFQDKLGRYGTIAVLTFIIILSGPWRRGLALDNVLLDSKGEVGRHFGLRALPATLFYGRDGSLQDIRIGALSKATLQERIERLR